MKTTKTILKTLLITVLTLSVINCSKDDNSGQNIRVKTYGVDANEYDLTYNNDGQLIGYETHSGNNSIVYNANNQIIQNGTTTYTYNAQGRMATITRPNVSSNIIYNNASLIAEINSTYTYNFGTSETSQTTIDYDSTNKIEKIIEYNSSISTYSKIELIYDDNDNIVQQKTLLSPDGVSYSNAETISYTYDNKLNPYYNILTKTGITSNINVIYIINAISLGNYVGYQGLSYHSKNNVLTSTTIKTTTATSTEQYTYSYNEANYPIAAEYNSSYRNGEAYDIYYNWTYETY